MAPTDQKQVVNQWADFLERVGWTITQFLCGVFLSWIATGNPLTWWTFLIAVASAVVKVKVAQAAGDHNDGSAWPGGVQKK